MTKSNSRYRRIKTNKNDTGKINIGLQFLRMICSFFIVLCHFYKFHHYNKIIYNKNSYYIIIFFYMSFYFSYNTLASRNISKIKLRFIKMLTPYIGWPLLLYLKDKFDHYYYKERLIHRFKHLYYQIIVGCKIYGIFWFLFVLIFIHLFFTLIIFIFKKIHLFILFISNIFIYYFFYSNYASILIFNKYKKVPVHHSIKPILEFFVFAFTGFYLASIQFINKLYKCRIIAFLISNFSLFIYIKYYNNYFKKMIKIYKGIIRIILVTFIFIIFSMLPFDKINNIYILTFLNKITSYTGGIFYIHVIMGEICKKHIRIIRKYTFKGCILLYFICYCACFIGSFIFQKSKLKYLFM